MTYTIISKLSGTAVEKEERNTYQAAFAFFRRACTTIPQRYVSLFRDDYLIRERPLGSDRIIVRDDGTAARIASEAARALGSRGGSANTMAQNKARAKNGKKGGRPRRVLRDPEQVIGKPASAMDRYDWMECYPVIEGQRIVGVVSALDLSRVLAGVGGGTWDEGRQAYIR